MNLKKINNILGIIISIGAVSLIFTIKYIFIIAIPYLFFIILKLFEFFKDDNDYTKEELIKETLLLLVNIIQPASILIILAVYLQVFLFKIQLFALVTLIFIVLFMVILTFVKFIKVIKILANYKKYTNNKILKELLYLFFTLSQSFLIIWIVVVSSFSCGCMR